MRPLVQRCIERTYSDDVYIYIYIHTRARLYIEKDRWKFSASCFRSASYPGLIISCESRCIYRNVLRRYGKRNFRPANVSRLSRPRCVKMALSRSYVIYRRRRFFGILIGVQRAGVFA